MPTVLISGGSGLIGKALTRALLAQGYSVIVLSRRAAQLLPQPIENLRFAIWDVKKGTIDRQAFMEADYIVHLAGAGVADKRWTQGRKAEIVQSRTESSALIATQLEKIPNRVKAVVSASAIGWYLPTPKSGPDHDLARSEDDPPDPGFLGEACRLWERSIDIVSLSGKRLVKIRTGIVLSNEGGALPAFKKSIPFGIAAILGNGKQIVSWIHIEDLCRIYIEAIQNEQLSGVCIMRSRQIPPTTNLW